MNDRYTQQEDQFSTGAGTLDKLGDDVRAQGQAARDINMGVETFGLIGTAVSGMVLDDADLLSSNITELGTACDEHAAGLRATREAYTGQEVNAEHDIRTAGEGLGRGE